MMIKRDAKWIYAQLAAAFTSETGLPWESYSSIKLRPIMADMNMDKLGPASMLLEIDSIEFEVDWLPDPEALATTLLAEINRLKPKVTYDALYDKDCYYCRNQYYHPDSAHYAEIEMSKRLKPVTRRHEYERIATEP